MSRRDEENEENKAFSDLCYDAWRDGYNPDDVSRDRFDDRCAAGYYPDEISYKSCLPHRDSPQEEQQYPNEEVEGCEDCDDGCGCTDGPCFDDDHEEAAHDAD